MGNSYTPEELGLDPWSASPRTPGPMGTNNDAGDPDTPSWFVGDTPGPLGHGDHADPNGKMCRMKPIRGAIEGYVADAQNKRKSDCDKVRDELQETYRIRDAFADVTLLRQAKEQNWTTTEFDAKVKEKLIGKPIDKKAAGYVSPMGINPENCRIQENWSIEKYRSEGLPDIIRTADLAHESAHRASCTKLRSMEYNAAMSFPDKFSKDEVKAYNAKIEVLVNWLRANCI